MTMNRWPVMSELYREQHPLLCEDISDEPYSPQFHRRLRPTSFRGRTRNNLKGAAAILTRWPDHWASFITYWWIGLGMICLMTFIIYNSLFTFPMVQIANSKPTDSVIRNSVDSTTQSTSLPLEVYMHVFVEENEEINLNEYIPYIEKISNKYNNFQYHLLVMYNDTNVKQLTDEENNEIAMNMIWGKDTYTKKGTLKKNNLYIEYISLTTYMDNSPLRKYWRDLPYHLIEFLTRAISIWNKGGITFNPNILTPRSPHSIYIDKLKTILHQFPMLTKSENEFKNTRRNNVKSGNRNQKLNNIRDIINALENEDNSINGISHETLAEAEDKNSLGIMKNEHHLFTLVEGENANEAMTDNKTSTESINVYMEPRTTGKKVLEPNTKGIISDSRNNDSSLYFERTDNTTRSLLPLFLEFLFRSKQKNETEPLDKTPTNTFHRKRKNAIWPHKNNNSLSSTHQTNEVERKVVTKYVPLIISAKEINKTNHNNNKLIEIPFDNEVLEKNESNRLTIDLKGNIIATATPCHAFLGTVFSNVVHHNVEETVTDFIIAELSVFCKGLLSSCMGIDLILL